MVNLPNFGTKIGLVGQLCVQNFLDFFSLSEQKEAPISDMTMEPFNRSCLVWRRRLFQWEEDLVGELETLLRDVKLTSETDKWFWKLEDDGVFTVKSAYLRLAAELVKVDPLPAMECVIFKKIWSSPAPSKIISFSWQLLYDRLPSKSNLFRRGVGQFLDFQNQNCVWCVNNQETGTHIFLHCCFAQTVWREVCGWLRLDCLIPPNLFILFLGFYEGTIDKKVRKGFLLIWHTTLWFLWKTRNGVIFRNVFKSPKEVADEIILTTWRWSVHRLNIAPCLLYEWQREPGICLGR
jgi:hypothetical protein